MNGFKGTEPTEDPVQNKGYTSSFILINEAIFFLQLSLPFTLFQISPFIAG